METRPTLLLLLLTPPPGEGAYASVDLCQYSYPGGAAAAAAAGAPGPPSASFTCKVAVKRVKPDAIHDEKEIKLYYNEAALLSGLRHPNIVNLLGMGCERDRSDQEMCQTMYLVEECMTGVWGGRRCVCRYLGCAIWQCYHLSLLLCYCDLFHCSIDLTIIPFYYPFPLNNNKIKLTLLSSSGPYSSSSSSKGAQE